MTTVKTKTEAVLRRIALAFACIALSAVALPLAAQEPDGAQIRVYDVTGVAPDDTLNVRRLDEAAQPLDAPIVAELPPDATAIQATGLIRLIDGTIWRELKVDGEKGWASSSFLKPSGPISYDLPEELQCSGTEPFWSLQLSDDGPISFRTPESQSDLVESRRRQPANDLSATIIETGSGETAIITHDRFCSDGMSDNYYPLKIILLRGEERPLAGCCHAR